MEIDYAVRKKYEISGVQHTVHGSCNQGDWRRNSWRIKTPQSHPAPLQDSGLNNFVAGTSELSWLHALLWQPEAPTRPGASGSAAQKPFSGLTRTQSDLQ